MKLEIELSDKDIEELKDLENYLAKKIIGIRAGISEVSVADKMAGKIFDAYIRITKGGEHGKRLLNG